jgi:hypothetical protein
MYFRFYFYHEFYETYSLSEVVSSSSVQLQNYLVRKPLQEMTIKEQLSLCIFL